MIRRALRGLLLALLAAPALAAGQQSETPASATIPGEAMYPRPSREVWDHARAVLQASGFRAERHDNKNQILVTQWRSYDADKFPALPFGGEDRVKRVQLHVMVATTHEPARVAVGAVVELDRRTQKGRQTVFAYRLSALEDWFLEALDTAIGAKHEPMAGTMSGRAEQVTRLTGATVACTPDAGEGVRPPVRLSNVQPLFPAEGFGSGQGKVLLNTVLTEHGTMTEVRVANPTQQFAHYEASARAAVSLWRYKPGSKDGCAIPVFTSVTVNYALR